MTTFVSERGEGWGRGGGFTMSVAGQGNCVSSIVCKMLFFFFHNKTFYKILQKILQLIKNFFNFEQHFIIKFLVKNFTKFYKEFYG